MRNYLFIDLHIHSKYSYETGCDSSPSEILDNSITKAIQVKKSMKEKIDEVVKNEPQKFNALLKEYCKFFADTGEKQNAIYNEIISSKAPVESLKKYFDTNAKCCISITDHQNIQGSAEAINIIKNNPKKYEMVDFISGIEVNAGLRCIGKNEEGFSDYKKCHALAYGYDINNPTFVAYSKLYNYKTNVIESIYDKTINYKTDIEIGKMVLLARKKVEELVGEKISLTEIAFVVENSKSANHVKNKFAKYIREKYPNVDFSKIFKECFAFTTKGNGNAISGSKLELDEYMLAIENAGGKFSIAHPYSIKKKMTKQEKAYYNNEFVDALIQTTNNQKFNILKSLKLEIDEYDDEIDNNFNKDDKKFVKNCTKDKIFQTVKKINKKSKKNYSPDEIYQAYVEFMYGRKIEEFIERVIKIRKNLNIDSNSFALEIFNKINLSGAKSKILYDLAKKYDLLLSGGSDHHGGLYPNNSIGKCFNKKFIESKDKNLFEMDNSELQEKIDITRESDFNNVLVEMPFVELVKNNQLPKNRQEIKFYNIPNGIMEFDNSLFDRKRTWIVKKDWTPESIKKYLDTTGIDHISRLQFRYINSNSEKEYSIQKTKERKEVVSNKYLMNEYDYDANIDYNSTKSTIQTYDDISLEK